MGRYRTAALLVALLSSSATAQQSDRGAALYSTQISFHDNEPVISIGIMDDQKQIQISAAGALKLLPEGPGGTEIVTGDGVWTVTLDGAAPARVSWRVEVQSFEAGDLEVIQKARREWKARGVVVRPIERGSVFGFFGVVMDTRRVVLATTDTYKARAKAEGAATALAAKYDVETGVTPILEDRARGTLVLSNGKTTVRARDVMWLSAVKPRGTLTVHDVEFGKGFHWHGRETRKYPGTLYVTVGRHGKLAVASMVGAETMLRGIVPSEIYPSAPVEALKAQAIAARGELLAKIGHRHLADPFVICSDVHCQAYRGNQREDDRTSRAVDATRGQMLFAHGHLVDTVFSASCGGHSEHNENVWSMTPKATLRGRPDTVHATPSPTEATMQDWVDNPPDGYCGRTRYGKTNYRWEKRVAVDAIRKGMQAQGNDVGVPREITVLKRGVSGRAYSVAVKGTNGRKTVINGELNIRKAFGGLKSSAFVLTEMPGPSGHPVNFTFRGAGFGHGVGMCQTGAIGRAADKKPVDEILKHYYQGAAIQRIY